MTSLRKTATTSVALLDAIAERWSPVGFADRPVPGEALRACLEAARWAPSSYNDQPWTFLVTFKGEPAWEALLGCLIERNQAWAHSAPILLLTVAREGFARNDKPNRFAQYDTGQAMAQLLVQATALGLYVHQMAGYDADRARAALRIPAGHTPMAAAALGYLGEPEALPEDLRAREVAPRTRKDLGVVVFGGAWGERPGLADA